MTDLAKLTKALHDGDIDAAADAMGGASSLQLVSFQPGMRGYITRPVVAANGATIAPMSDTAVRFGDAGIDLTQGDVTVTATHAELWGVLVLVGGAL